MLPADSKHPASKRIGSTALAIVGILAVALPAAKASSALDGTLMADSCHVREISRQRLSLTPDRPLYVEPRAFEASGETVLLAGWPVYVSTPETSGSYRIEAPDSVIGALISRNGQIRLIPAPIPARMIGTMRALARPQGGWDVVFSELIPHSPGMTFRPDTAAVVWYGVLTERGWESMDSIPLMALTGLRYSRGSDSRLLRHADTLYWAYSSPSDSASEIHVLSMVHGRWRTEMVSGRGGYVDLAYDATAGLVIAAIRPDTTLMEDVNSLFIYQRSRGWAWRKRIALGASSPTHNPRFTLANGTLAISWTAEEAGMQRLFFASRNPLDSASVKAILIDSLLAAPLPQALATGAGRPVWLTHHGPEGGPRTVRLYELDDNTPRIILERDSPFMATVRATARGRDEILVIGTSWDPRNDRAPASQLVTLRVPTCA